MGEIIRLEEIAYTYEGSRRGLKSISLKIGEGEKIAVLGANGAGKSTFFLCCNGVLRPDRGKIWLEREPVDGKKDRIHRLRQTVGLVFQESDHQLIGGTVEEEISFGPMNLGLPTGEVRQRVEQAVRDMDLASYQDRAPHELSGGEKKRVTIADVLAMHPKLILMDEPASSLDPSGEKRLEEILETLNHQGISLAVATHDVDFAWRWADRGLVFHQGRLRADRPIEEIFADRELVGGCGLGSPLLYEVGTSLGLDPPPRTLQEFNEKIRSLGMHPS